MSEIKPCPSWTCFHCGETFTTPGSARDHFGFDPSSDPACRIKLGAERGLVMALRKAEADCEEMRRLLHDEASEAYRLYASQATRHREQIMAAEESGYEKGLTDGRVEADRASDACASVQRERDAAVEVLEWYADQMCEGWCDGDPKAAVGIGAENCAGCPARGFFANREGQQS